jgi:hypothetical protein
VLYFVAGAALVVAGLLIVPWWRRLVTSPRAPRPGLDPPF